MRDRDRAAGLPRKRKKVDEPSNYREDDARRRILQAQELEYLTAKRGGSSGVRSGQVEASKLEACAWLLARVSQRVGPAKPALESPGARGSC